MATANSIPLWRNPGGRKHMAAVTEDDAADPARLVSELRRQLAICRAERDAAAARETATAEVLQLINARPAWPHGLWMSMT